MPRRLPSTRLLPAALCAAALACACAGPVGPEIRADESRHAPSQKVAQARAEQFAYAVQADGGRFTTLPDMEAYVAEVGGKLAAASGRTELPWEFVVLHNPVPIAWSWPLGKVAVSRGLLMELENEAELAAVLAHEVAHVTRHGARRSASARVPPPGGVQTQSDAPPDVVAGEPRKSVNASRAWYDDPDELEADRAGVDLLAAAGYDPGAAARLMSLFMDLELAGAPDWDAGLFTEHPPSRRREVGLAKAAERHPPSEAGDGPEYAERIRPLLAAAPSFDTLSEGYADLADGKPEAALEAVGAALAGAPEEARLFALRGEALAALDRPDRAEAALTRSISLEGDYYRHFLVRGLLRRDAGDAEGARADLERSIGLLPTAAAHRALGTLLLAAGDSDAGRRHLRAALTAGGPDGRAAGKVLTRLELADAPGRYVEAAARLNPEGYVLVGLHNRSPLPVRGITVTVAVEAAEGPPQRTLSLTFDDPLGPGEARFHPTTIGPFQGNGPPPVRVTVTAAELAE